MRYEQSNQQFENEIYALYSTNELSQLNSKNMNRKE